MKAVENARKQAESQLGTLRAAMKLRADRRRAAMDGPIGDQLTVDPPEHLFTKRNKREEMTQTDRLTCLFCPARFNNEADRAEHEKEAHWHPELKAPAPDPSESVPKRQRLLQADSETRKRYPLATGLLDYFPDALAEVAKLSLESTEKHHPGEPMHHERGISEDHADCIVRHLVGRGGFDGKTRESAALAWRALALLQQELEEEFDLPLPRGARPTKRNQT